MTYLYNNTPNIYGFHGNITPTNTRIFYISSMVIGKCPICGRLIGSHSTVEDLEKELNQQFMKDDPIGATHGDYIDICDTCYDKFMNSMSEEDREEINKKLINKNKN
jgi:hypothetical protein